MAKDPTKERWETRTFTIQLDVGTYGADVDDEEIAYLLRMGGIDADTVESLRTDPQAPQGGNNA